ncbi:MAG: cyclic nucleotide-binding domain-containing protein [Anaerolineaceae bacterium]|nr:cyclic nucleotide-binding domain-containing protein [Anaerolineaceae bacterium]
MLSVIENVILPMDFCNSVPVRERCSRALDLLEMVDMAEHAYKLPAALSGGQQQRVAIARALANDPPLIIADEPTGNLDSKTADAMFNLFERLAAEGKTVVMVTHDSSLARRVSRTVIIADGEVVNEYIAQALPALSPQVMLEISRRAQCLRYPAGATVIREGERGEKFYIVTQGTAEVKLKRPGGSDVVAARMGPGQVFGEISLYNNSRTVASVQAQADLPLEVLAVGYEDFQNFLASSPDFDGLIQAIVQNRIAHNQAVIETQV